MVTLNDKDAIAVLVLLNRIQLQANEAAHFVRIVDVIKGQLSTDEAPELVNL